MPKIHRVMPGDCIDSIAFNAGQFPDKIWNDHANAELKNLRKDPDVLQPGDRVTIPDKEPTSIACASDQMHRFRRKGIPKELSLQLLNPDHTPMADTKVQMDIDGKLVKCKTDADGWVKLPISPAARQATIILENGSHFKCKLGYLDPIDCDTGVQQRLQNLGFYSERINSTLSEDAINALQAFQKANGLELTDACNAKTNAALLKLSGD